MKHYVLFIEGDVEPGLVGPYGSTEERDSKAVELKREHGDEHGIYWLNVVNGVTLGAYHAGFFMGEE